MISSQPRLDKRSEQRRAAGTYSFLVKIHKEKKKKKEREKMTLCQTQVKVKEQTHPRRGVINHTPVKLNFCTNIYHA